MERMTRIEALLAEEVCELSGSSTKVFGLLGGSSKDRPEGNVADGMATSIDAMRTTGNEPGALCSANWQRIAWEPFLRKTLLVGLGDADEFDTGKARRVAAAATRESKGTENLVLVIDTSWLTAGPMESVCEAVVEGFLLALDGPRRDQVSGVPNRLVIQVDSSDLVERAREGIRAGTELAKGAILARRVADAPAATMTPYDLAAFCRAELAGVGVSVSVMSGQELNANQFAGTVAVGRGSANPPSFTTLEYAPDCEPKSKIVLVGKGITFDSGGLSLKDRTRMQRMKYDKAGAAAVIGAVHAAASLSLPIHVVGLIPAAENLPSSMAYRPGDVITMANGTSIEIVSTDAEGRLLLADALLYANRFCPDCVIDIATLTGGVRAALGSMALGLFSNTTALLAELQEAGEAEDELLWPLPLLPEMRKQLRGEMADLKNSTGPAASASMAAAFLREFVKYPWAHIDIAGTAWDNDTREFYPKKGASGVGVRTLVRLLRMRSQ